MFGCQSKNVPLWKNEHRKIYIFYRSYINRRGHNLFCNEKHPLKNIFTIPKASISKVKLPNKRAKVLYILPGIAFCLGVWQVRRREWKLNLIHELNTKINFPPIELPNDVTSSNDLTEYQPIKVKGQFDHNREILVGPTPFNPDFDPTHKFKNETDQHKPKFKPGMEPRGYHVVTPLVLENSKKAILIDRGWVPESQQNPGTRISGQISGIVEVVGLVRHGSPGSCNSRTGVYNLRNIEEMASKTGSLPIFLEATFDPNSKFGPIGGQTIINLRNAHLEYSIFWFSVAAGCLAYMKYFGK